MYFSETELKKQLRDTTDARFLIEKLDFIFSKGKLSLDMEATEPTINTERRVNLLCLIVSWPSVDCMSHVNRLISV